MQRTQVYSWRLDPDVKRRIEERARSAGVSVAELLSRIVGEWLERPDADGTEAEQRRLHAAIDAAVGSIAGGDPSRSRNVRSLVRGKLARRRRSPVS